MPMHCEFIKLQSDDLSDMIRENDELHLQGLLRL